MKRWNLVGKKSARRAIAIGSVGLLALAGCDANIYDAPLPGGPDVGDNPMQVTVEFRDVLDLVPQSNVKVNDVTVGQVTAVDLKGYTAVVTLELPSDTDLPDNVRADLRQTSLLGEKFVSLEAPSAGSSGNRLADGAVIPLRRSGRNPEVEEVLGALSLLLSGGGVAQLNTITKELNKALEGREGAARSVFRQLRTFTSELDDNKGDILNAIESLNRLSVEAKAQLPTIDAALDELPSALRSIDRQRDDLVRMLRSLNNLSDVAVGVIQKSKATTIQSLKLLRPILDKLAQSGDDFVNAFHVLLTYPFVDEAVGRDPQVARNLHMGDYTNLSITLEAGLFDQGDTIPDTLPTLPTNPLNPGPQQQPPQRPNPPILPQLPALPGPRGGASGGGLPDLLGLGRAAVGAPAPQRVGTGPTYGQLMTTYDAGLVSLLVPGMVTQ